MGSTSLISPGAGVALALATCIALAGCAAYSPRAVSLDAYPSRQAAQTLSPAPGGGWNQSALLRIALAASPQIAKAEAALLSAQAAARSARVGPALTLTLTAEYADEANVRSPWLVGGAVDAPIEGRSRREPRLTAADLAVLRARYDLAEAVWSIRMSVRKSTINLAFAQAGLSPAEQAAALRGARAAQMERRVRAGEDDRGAALVAQAEAAAARRRLDQAKQAMAQAQAAMASALSLSPTAVSEVAMPLLGAAPDAGDLQTRRLEAALTRRDVLSAVTGYDAAEAALRLEIARQYPAVSLGPGYTWERGVTKLPFNLALALPPSDLNRAAISEAEARRVEAGRAVEQIQTSVLAGVDQAAAALAAAKAAASRIESEDLPLAHRAAQLTQVLLKAGAADRGESDAAQAAYAERRLEAMDLARQSWQALADLEDALRKPFDPAEPAILQAAAQPSGAAR